MGGAYIIIPVDARGIRVKERIVSQYGIGNRFPMHATGKFSSGTIMVHVQLETSGGKKKQQIGMIIMYTAGPGT